MSHDEAFIQDILAHPDDLGLRLIYADWLDERDDPRGTFLRAEAAYRALPEDDERRLAVRERLREMAAQLDGRWRTRLDLPLIENCSVAFAFECPKQWQQLHETKESDVRYCGECRKHVFYAASVAEARQHAWLGHCVAVDTRQEREPGDLEDQTMTMGMIVEESRPPEAWRPGEIVEIVDGPYSGNAGHIVSLEVAEKRATVRIRIDGKPTVVTVDLDQLEPIE